VIYNANGVLVDDIGRAVSYPPWLCFHFGPPKLNGMSLKGLDQDKILSYLPE